MAKLSRDEEIRRFFDEMELAPAGKEISVAARANAYADELAAMGQVTMRQLTAFGVVSRKTVEKHMRTGLLTGRKVKISGVPTWLFEPEHAQRYLESVTGITRRSVGEQKKRERAKATAPDGHVTVAELAARTGLSRWAIYDCLTDGRLASVGAGFKGAKLITDAEATRFARNMAGKARPSRLGREPKPPVARPTARERRPIIVQHRMVLVFLVLDQPGETVVGLARDLKVGAQTVRNWADGHSQPDDGNTGRLVAYARGRYAIRVGPELDELGKAHRASYMTGYMRKQRVAED